MYVHEAASNLISDFDNRVSLYLATLVRDGESSRNPMWGEVADFKAEGVERQIQSCRLRSGVIFRARWTPATTVYRPAALHLQDDFALRSDLLVHHIYA